MKILDNHIPVLLNEVLEIFNPKQGEKYIDATMGFAGHAKAIAQKGASVLGVEIESAIIKITKKENSAIANLIAINDSFVRLKNIARQNGFEKVSGILFDLGVSSWHFDASQRGFSFNDQTSLDMRFNQQGDITASEIVNRFTEKDLITIFQDLGQERFSQRIAKAIIKARPIYTAKQLANVIERAVPQRGRIHPATKIFQALRIFINNELEAIEQGLEQAIGLLQAQGKLIVISFHSLEDGLVKNFFRKNAKQGILRILTKKPLTATLEEIQRNPKARSAKLRAAVKN